MTTRHAAQTAASLSSSPGGEVDARRLETIEDLSESLANQLLELSVATRDRDRKLIADFFPAELAATPFPSVPNKVKPELKWIGTRAWSVEGATSSTATTGASSARL